MGRYRGGPKPWEKDDPDVVPQTGEYHYPGMDQHKAIEWLMASSDGTAIDSWHWLIEFTTTSFYIKSMNRALQAMKVSIHGQMHVTLTWTIFDSTSSGRRTCK